MAEGSARIFCSRYQASGIAPTAESKISHRKSLATSLTIWKTVAPSTFRQSALRLHDAKPPGYVVEPTSFLLHILDGASCVTHSVAISHAAAVSAF